MAKEIQRYIPVRPGRTRNNPLPNTVFTPRASVANFGGNRSQANWRMTHNIQNALLAVGENIEDRRKREDLDRVRDADNSSTAEMRNIMSDYMSLQGQDAIGQLDNLSTDLDSLIRQTAEDKERNLSPQAQSYYRDVAHQRANRYKDSYANHQFKEGEKFHDQTLAAKGENLVQDGVSAVVDPNMSPRRKAINIAKLEMELIGVTDERSKNQGFSPEMAEAARREIVSDMYTSSVGALMQINDDPHEAKNFAYLFRKKIEPNAYAQIKDDLDLRIEAYDIKQDAIKLSQIPPEDVQGALDKMKGKTPEYLDKLRKEVERRQAKEASDERIAEQRFVDAEWVKQLEDPEAEIDPTLPHQTQLQMQSYQAQMEKSRKAAAGIGVDAITNYEVYDMINLMPASQLVNYDIHQHNGDLHPTEYKELLNKKSKARAGQREFTSQAISKQITDRATVVYGTTAKRDLSDQQEAERFHATVNNSIRLLPDDKRTTEEITRILDTVTQEMTRGRNMTRSEVVGLVTGFAQQERLQRELPENLEVFDTDKTGKYRDVRWDSSRKSYVVELDGRIDYYDVNGVYINSDVMEIIPKVPSDYKPPTADPSGSIK